MPKPATAVYRRSGGGVGEFRPVFTHPAGELRRMDELTVAEIQTGCSYVRDEKGLAADVKTVLSAAATLVRG